MEGIQTLPFPYGFGGFARPDERTVDFRVRYTFGGLFFSPEGAQVFSHGRQPVEYRPHLRKSPGRATELPFPRACALGY